MSTPTTYSGYADTGIPYREDGLWGQGPIGDVFAVTFHHSAGARAKSKAQAIRLHKAYDQQHRNQGWGGIGYHASMDDLGRVYKLRPADLRGTHTGGHNTGNLGFMIHGNYDHDRLNDDQKGTLRWLFQGGFYALFGALESGIDMVRGHQEWPGPTNATACPGKDVMRSLVFRRNADFH